jgi:hypothetical protein
MSFKSGSESYGNPKKNRECGQESHDETNPAEDIAGISALTGWKAAEKEEQHAAREDPPSVPDHPGHTPILSSGTNPRG